MGTKNSRLGAVIKIKSFSDQKNPTLMPFNHDLTKQKKEIRNYQTVLSMEEFLNLK